MPGDRGWKRRRISQACKPCSSRKVKCDGGVPSCGRCTSANFQCFYGVSKRNTHLPHPSLGNTSSQALQQASRSERSQDSETTPSVLIRRPASSLHLPVKVSAVVPFHFSSRLFQTYFRSIHPIWPILYKPLYSSLDHEQILEALPQSLVYAILSLAVLIHEPEDNRQSKDDQAKHFFDEALKSLANPGPLQSSRAMAEVKPSIANCQVYTLLALQQHGIGEFSQAGTLCAIAASMAIDRSLHRLSDSDNHVEAQVKSRLWWNIYVLEKMLSCEMGRPALLRAEEAETPFPSVEESDEYEFYTDIAQVNNIIHRRRLHSLKLRTISAFHTSIRITMIMEKVSREIYSVTARQCIRTDRETGEKTRLRLWAELQEFETMMENSPLKLERTGKFGSTPVTVTNYVYMWSTTILLHRPFMETWHSNSINAGTAAMQKDPHEICLFAANQICSTIEIYTNYMCGLPCDMIFPIFVAANILLHRWRRNKDDDVLIKKRLDLCVKWLLGLGKSWKSAKPRYEMLSESINPISQNAQAEDTEPLVVRPSDLNEPSNAPTDHWNSGYLLTEDNFELEFLHWLESTDYQP